METVTLIPGEHVENAVLPEELRMTDVEVQTHVDETGVPPTFVVPSDDELQAQETALESLMVDAQRLRLAREAIIRNGNKLSTIAAASLRTAVECVCDKPAIVDPAAFQTGEEGAGAYALESVIAAEESLFQRFVNMMKNWARSLYLWLQQRLSKRTTATKGLEAVKRELVNIVSIPLTQGGFQGLRLLPANIVAQQGIDAGISKTASSFDALTAEMRDLLQGASVMFRETSTSKAGVFDGPEATMRMVDQVSKRPMFNTPALGGIVWNIQTDKIKTYDGGHSYHTFSVQTHSATRDHVEGEISKGAFQSMVQSVERAIAQSENIISTLSAYAKTLTAAARPGTETRQNNFGVDRKIMDFAPMRSVLSAATALRTSAQLYDRVVLSAAIDLTRATRFANKK